MSKVVLLDTGPLGLITNPKLSPESTACNRWLQMLITSNVRVIIPEIVDYELRRELLRAEKMKGIQKLDELIELLEYSPITTTVMRQAALLWAQARKKGQPTAGDKTIDGDIILIAQAVIINASNSVIATTNVGHLSRFFAADLWNNIAPSQKII